MITLSKILGIDPGSRVTGFGVIALEGTKTRYLSSGCIRVQAVEIPQRLGEIYQEVSRLVNEYQPQALAIERVFLHRNVDSALKLGQARGAALVAAVNHGLAIYEYSPNVIKQTVAGRGHADKAQIQYMVKTLLNLSAIPPPDAADALAAALCHAHHCLWGTSEKPPAKTARAKSWRQFKP